MVLCVPSFILLKLASFCVLLSSLHLGASVNQDAKETVFTNGWAVKIKGGFERAKRLAEKFGFDKVEKVGSLDDYYHLEHPKHPRRSKRSAEDKTQVLLGDHEVEWAEQQHEKIRTKRGHFHDRMVSRGIIPRFKDPLWDGQWYLDDKRKDLDLDVHVLPVWNRGITGKGVVVTILDDGIEHNHTDLIRNYDPAASWDVNDRDADPFPRYDPSNENKHGTRCAGEVAAQANNTYCGVGVSYNAKIGGVRMLDGRVTDNVEAMSLSLSPQYIDIYSASWGPSDDGTTVEGPGTLATAAFENGIQKGRGGLGSIYVWASGNGGRHDDSCNCDGYTNSIYTLSISSASDHGESPWYSESCSSTLATTFSSGAHGEKRIVTTDLHDGCTERHTGTSASAPLAAGIIALALEVNKQLTWRDIQHIVVHTSNVQPLSQDQDWMVNGVGLKVNMKFGFGLLDADKITKMADPATYKTVPEKSLCHGQIIQDARPLNRDTKTRIVIHAEGCLGSKDEIRYLEHVQLLISLHYTRRGDLTIKLTSPMGTVSTLLPSRSEDTSTEGFKKWPFTTTHNWGEDPRGNWILEIQDLGDGRANTGSLSEMQLILHGTKEKPNHLKVEHPDVKPQPKPQPVPQPKPEEQPHNAPKPFPNRNQEQQQEKPKSVIPAPAKALSDIYAAYTDTQSTHVEKPQQMLQIPKQVPQPLQQQLPQPLQQQVPQQNTMQTLLPMYQQIKQLQLQQQQLQQQQLQQQKIQQQQLQQQQLQQQQFRQQQQQQRQQILQQMSQQVPQQAVHQIVQQMPQQVLQQLPQQQQVPVQNDATASYQGNYAPAEYSSSIKYVESAPSLFSNQYQSSYVNSPPRYEVNQAVNNGNYPSTGYVPSFSPPPSPPSPTTKLSFQSSNLNDNLPPADPSKMNILDFLKILRSRGEKKAPIDRFRQKKEALRTQNERLS